MMPYYRCAADWGHHGLSNPARLVHVRVEGDPPFGFHRLIQNSKGMLLRRKGLLCPRADREVPAIYSGKERLFFVERALPETTVKTRYSSYLRLCLP